MQSGFDINRLRQEALIRWLKPAEVFFILKNHESFQLTHEPPKRPPSGSLFLFNRRVLRFFRKDGYVWRKKRDGRTISEAHERLKVENVNVLNCYYAHGEPPNLSLQRRSYWMLDPAYEHIVLVHYREITEGIFTSRNIATPSINQELLAFNHVKDVQLLNSHGQPLPAYRDHNKVGDVQEQVGYSDSQMLDFAGGGEKHQKQSGSSSSAIVSNKNEPSSKDMMNLSSDSAQTDLYVTDILTPDSDPEALNFSTYALETVLPHEKDTFFRPSQQETISGPLNEQLETQFWDRLDVGGNGHQISHSESGSHLSAARRFLFESDSLIESPTSHLPEGEKVQNYTSEAWNLDQQSSLVPGEGNDTDWLGPVTSGIENNHYSSDYSGMWDDASQFEIPLTTDSSVTVSQKQLFSIREISPEWAFTSGNTKVIIAGAFLCNALDFSWSVMFDDIEVRAEIVQEGILRCRTPQHGTGKVTLCVTSSNRESCSELREFEFCADSTNSNSAVTSLQPDASKNDEELKLLMSFTKMLLCRPDSAANHVESFGKVGLTDNMLEQLTVTLPDTVDWILQELLKDKLQQWLLSRRQMDGTKCFLSKQEQGIIHVISGLGYEWALSPILEAGVGINFRDAKGWTALHWAARFGREEMVAVLIAAGASAGAVTDPTSHDPLGKTAASVAAAHGHHGLAGYLSEAALTSHLSSLTLEESEIYKGSAEVEAERKMESISQRSNELHVGGTEDELSLKDFLAAARNATQAAARIQSAFRVYSFRKKQLKTSKSCDPHDFGLTQEELNALSSASKFRWSFNGPRDYKYGTAALSIQKKFRSWHERKAYVNMRKNVMKIQAHVRGYQTRKKYKELLWAVNVLEKAILRWLRKGDGLRGFQPEHITEDDEDEDEDIVRLLRKQKINPALDQAVARVLTLVESTEARKQYHRILERYRQAMEHRPEGTAPSDSCM
ncbi:P-loop containing nucleoside triphosphate hydrolase protein [Dioscorea alata]|uniref:P-loop containing nucleoside triphosphate hydrolase protein n=1 Tax=Dioscorea alata TaxID=55571 RepID=A0ACB7W6L8_DIOAL|nr:P-loop containing nucleoside triphosphate hydrolase protein [Dioscorea alata]